MVTPRAWLVDLDGTLYRGPWVRAAMGLELLLGNWHAVRALHYFRSDHERLRHELTRAVESPYVLQLARTAAALGMSQDDLEALVTHWMIRRPSKWIWAFRRRRLLDRIRRFRAQGGRTALVSDYPARGKLQALGMEESFEVVVANGEAGGPGRLKPWPDSYLLAARRLGVEPADCLVLGDRADVDGEAARRAGMQFRLIAGKRACGIPGPHSGPYESLAG